MNKTELKTKIGSVLVDNDEGLITAADVSGLLTDVLDCTEIGGTQATIKGSSLLVGPLKIYNGSSLWIGSLQIYNGSIQHQNNIDMIVGAGTVMKINSSGVTISKDLTVISNNVNFESLSGSVTCRNLNVKDNIKVTGSIILGTGSTTTTINKDGVISGIKTITGAAGKYIDLINGSIAGITVSTTIPSNLGPSNIYMSGSRASITNCNKLDMSPSASNGTAGIITGVSGIYFADGIGIISGTIGSMTISGINLNFKKIDNCSGIYFDGPTCEISGVAKISMDSGTITGVKNLNMKSGIITGVSGIYATDGYINRVSVGNSDIIIDGYGIFNPSHTKFISFKDKIMSGIDIISGNTTISMNSGTITGVSDIYATVGYIDKVSADNGNITIDNYGIHNPSHTKFIYFASGIMSGINIISGNTTISGNLTITGTISVANKSFNTGMLNKLMKLANAITGNDTGGYTLPSGAFGYTQSTGVL